MAREKVRGVALVTGASRGIGRAIAKRLAAQHDILAVARSTEELETLAAEIDSAGGRCDTRRLDVTDASAVRRALEGERVDVLVNNAGVAVLKPFLELSPEEWRTMVDTNINALHHVTSAVLRAWWIVARGTSS